MEAPSHKKQIANRDFHRRDGGRHPLRALLAGNTEAASQSRLRDFLFKRVLGAAAGGGQKCEPYVARLRPAPRIFRHRRGAGCSSAAAAEQAVSSGSSDRGGNWGIRRSARRYSARGAIVDTLHLFFLRR